MGAPIVGPAGVGDRAGELRARGGVPGDPDLGAVAVAKEAEGGRATGLIVEERQVGVHLQPMGIRNTASGVGSTLYLDRDQPPVGEAEQFVRAPDETPSNGTHGRAGTHGVHRDERATGRAPGPPPRTGREPCDEDRHGRDEREEQAGVDHSRNTPRRQARATATARTSTDLHVPRRSERVYSSER
jgi:hypothetical protein